MGEFGPAVPEEVIGHKIDGQEHERPEQAKPKSVSELVFQAKHNLLNGLAGRTLPGGRRIPPLNSEGRLPTFENRGNSYVTYIGDAMDAMPLKDLAALPEGQGLIRDFFAAEGIDDPAMQKKIMEAMK